MVSSGGRLVPSGSHERATRNPNLKEHPMLVHFVSLQNFLTRRLRRDDRGATAVEYGLIVALIAGVIVLAVTTMGTTISTAFQNVIKGF